MIFTTLYCLSVKYSCSSHFSFFLKTYCLVRQSPFVISVSSILGLVSGIFYFLEARKWWKYSLVAWMSTLRGKLHVLLQKQNKNYSHIVNNVRTFRKWFLIILIFKIFNILEWETFLHLTNKVQFEIKFFFNMKMIN